MATGSIFNSSAKQNTRRRSVNETSHACLSLFRGGAVNIHVKASLGRVTCVSSSVHSGKGGCRGRQRDECKPEERREGFLMFSEMEELLC